MKRLRWSLILVVLTLLALVGSAAAQGGDPPRAWAMDSIRLAIRESAANASPASIERKNLVDDIYEYTLLVQVGPGEFDKIGVHRVVKEEAPWIPITTRKAVMLLHGDTFSFESAFLGSTLSDKVPRGQSLGVYLAQNDIDVWGVDRRWVLIPDNVTDLSFMKTWDTALDVNDTRLAVKIARAARALTGSGPGQIFMLGHSRGAQILYAYANQETQLPRGQRDLSGMIPVDMVYQYAPTETGLRAQSLQIYLVNKAAFDSGVYYTAQGRNTRYVAQLAALAPNNPSPLLPGFTNRQAALFALTSTYALSPLRPIILFYHGLAGTFDSNGIPTGFQFTNYDYSLDLLALTPSFVSVADAIDGAALMSGQVDTPYDDYLSQVEIPVFYVGAAGGYGERALYTPSLLGSRDKSELIIKFYPTEAAALDYGHVDLLWAGNAQSLVWTPIYNWIVSH